MSRKGGETLEVFVAYTEIILAIAGLLAIFYFSFGRAYPEVKTEKAKDNEYQEQNRQKLAFNKMLGDIDIDL